CMKMGELDSQQAPDRIQSTQRRTCQTTSVLVAQLHSISSQCSDHSRLIQSGQRW
ncbi:hypothetical protein T265_15975, partial [Opisthorchis viverrini]